MRRIGMINPGYVKCCECGKSELKEFAVVIDGLPYCRECKNKFGKLEMKIGDKVTVTHKAKRDENGWHNSWVKTMDKQIGKVVTITRVDETKKEAFIEEDCYAYPLHVLEPVKTMMKVGDKVRIIGGHYSNGEKWGEVVGQNGIITGRYSGKSFDWYVDTVPWGDLTFSENELELIEDTNTMRTFESGATRHTDADKLDYEGFFNPLIMKRYAEYLHKHRLQADGKLRDSDNWQRGIPVNEYMKSKFRHFIDTFLIHRGYANQAENPNIEETLCAELFNTMGMLLEVLRKKSNEQGNIRKS